MTADLEKKHVIDIANFPQKCINGYGVTEVRGSFMRKNCCSFGFFPNEGKGGGPGQIFWYIFISEFLLNKMSQFPPKCQ